MKNNNMPRCQLQLEKGATLIVSLIMLLLLTVIGITGASNVSLVERITGNISDKSEARQTCEMALRQGERSLESLPGGIAPTASSEASNSRIIWGLGAAGGSATTLDSSWMKTNWPAAAVTASNAVGTSYFIEEAVIVADKANRPSDYAAGGPPATYYYRVSATTQSTRVAYTICQSTYARRFK